MRILQEIIQRYVTSFPESILFIPACCRKKCKYRPKSLIGWELLSFEQDMSGPPRDERYRIEEMNVWQEEGRFSKWG